MHKHTNSSSNTQQHSGSGLEQAHVVQSSSEPRPVRDCPRYFVDAAGNLYFYSKHHKRMKQRSFTWQPQTGTYRFKWRTKNAEGRVRNFNVHTAVLEAFKGPRPSSNHVARHLNGNQYDNRIENLEWGTFKENTEDMYRHGRGVFHAGERNHSAKISERVARAVYSSKDALTRKQTMLLFDVGEKTVANIWNKRNWKCLHG